MTTLLKSNFTDIDGINVDYELINIGNQNYIIFRFRICGEKFISKIKTDLDFIKCITDENETLVKSEWLKYKLRNNVRKPKYLLKANLLYDKFKDTRYYISKFVMIDELTPDSNEIFTISINKTIFSYVHVIVDLPEILKAKGKFDIPKFIKSNNFHKDVDFLHDIIDDYKEII